MSERLLSRKQQLFCKEYLVDLNATQAAIRAGYSKKTAQRMGSENLSKPLLAKNIQKQMNKRVQRTEINADYVLSNIKSLAENCAELVETEQGPQARNPSAALKGYELLGKHLVMFTDKVQHTGDVQLTGFKVVLGKK